MSATGPIMDSPMDGEREDTMPEGGHNNDKREYNTREEEDKGDTDKRPNGVDDTTQKLDAMSHEREALLGEVHELRRQLESLKTSHGEEVKALEGAHKDEIKSIRTTHADEIKTLETTHADEIKTIQTTHAEEKKTLETTHTEEKKTLESAHADKIKTFENTHVDEIKTIQTTHAEEISTLQATHTEEISTLQTELDESNAARDTAEEQYQNLMGRVEKIKETLSDRLRRDRLELDEAKERVDELESEAEQLRTRAANAEAELASVRVEMADSVRELTSLRSRNNLSAQNWMREKDDLAATVLRLKKEIESTSNAMGEWEVLAMEERSVKDGLVEKVADMQRELADARTGHDTASRERDALALAVDRLQRSLQEIQDARKRELREMVESTQQESKLLKDLVRQADARAVAAETARDALTKELERTAPFEDAVKEKNLLIGKLRHEAIVLNEHLTKALRYLKKTKPDDNVDRQIVTNHLLHFLALDRADPKRFQILQVMAGYLNWTDEQREQAGLARPGASSGASSTGLRLPISPFNRTSSTPSLSADFLSDVHTAASVSGASSSQKESLADLWEGFLERSATDQADSGTAPSSRKGSVSSAATRPDLGR